MQGIALVPKKNKVKQFSYVRLIAEHCSLVVRTLIHIQQAYGLILGQVAVYPNCSCSLVSLFPPCKYWNRTLK
jgi:hypothetical protein